MRRFGLSLLAVVFLAGGCADATEPTSVESEEGDENATIGGKGDQMDDSAGPDNNYGYFDKVVTCRGLTNPSDRKECYYDVNDYFAEQYKKDLTDAGVDFEGSAVPDPVKSLKNFREVHVYFCRGYRPENVESPWNRCRARAAATYGELIGAHRTQGDVPLVAEFANSGLGVSDCYETYNEVAEDIDDYDGRKKAVNELHSCVRDRVERFRGNLVELTDNSTDLTTEEVASSLGIMFNGMRNSAKKVCHSLVGKDTDRIKCRADAAASMLYDFRPLLMDVYDVSP